MAVGALGVRRVRVVEWLDDDPYPRAAVEDWPDVPGEVDPAALDAVTSRFRRVLARAAELGLPVPPATVALDPEPAVAVLQMTVATPFGPADRFDLLCADGPRERMILLEELLEGQEELIEAQVAMGGSGDLGEGFGEDPEGL